MISATSSKSAASNVAASSPKSPSWWIWQPAAALWGLSSVLANGMAERPWRACPVKCHVSGSQSLSVTVEIHRLTLRP